MIHYKGFEPQHSITSAHNNEREPIVSNLE